MTLFAFLIYNSSPALIIASIVVHIYEYLFVCPWFFFSGLFMKILNNKLYLISSVLIKNLQYCVCLGKIISACVVFIHVPKYGFADFSIMFNYIGMVNLFKFINICVIFICPINNCVSDAFYFTSH